MDQNCENDVDTNCCRETSEVLVLILFDKTLTKSFCNTVIKEKNIIHNYGHGEMVGYTEEIRLIEGEWPLKYTMGIIKFDSIADAKKWNFSDPLTKQQDWLDQVEMYVVPLFKPFTKREHQVLELVNCDVLNKEVFYNEYCTLHCQTSAAHGGYGVIACTDKVEKWRGRHSLCHVTISLWPTIDSYAGWRESAEYQQVKEKKNEAFAGETVIAELRTKV